LIFQIEGQIMLQQMKDYKTIQELKKYKKWWRKMRLQAVLCNDLDVVKTMDEIEKENKHE